MPNVAVLVGRREGVGVDQALRGRITPDVVLVPASAQTVSCPGTAAQGQFVSEINRKDGYHEPWQHMCSTLPTKTDEDSTPSGPGDDPACA